jgi:hypothetical protein
MCRLSRTSAELMRTAATLERALSQRQMRPVPFFGSVAAEEVDIPALHAVWCKRIPTVAGAGSRSSASPRPIQQPVTRLRRGGEACDRG